MANTMISGTNTGVGVSGANAAPGGTGPGATISIAKSAVVFLGLSIGGLVALKVIFGDKASLPPMRVDPTEVAKVYLAFQTLNIPLKLLAYHFHGHAFSQALLTFS